MTNNETTEYWLDLLQKSKLKASKRIMTINNSLKQLEGRLKKNAALLAELGLHIVYVKDWELMLNEQMPAFDLATREHIPLMKMEHYLGLRYMSLNQDIRDIMPDLVQEAEERERNKEKGLSKPLPSFAIKPLVNTPRSVLPKSYFTSRRLRYSPIDEDLEPSITNAVAEDRKPENSKPLSTIATNPLVSPPRTPSSHTFVTPPRQKYYQLVELEEYPTPTTTAAVQQEEPYSGPSTSKNAKIKAVPTQTIKDDNDKKMMAINDDRDSTSNSETAEKENNVAKPYGTTPKRKLKNKLAIESCLHRLRNNIKTPPTFIDGDGTRKSININEIDTSVDQKESKIKKIKIIPRFGDAKKIDTVILGSNGTTVSKWELNMINWTAEPSDCVRKVLLTVFDREVLACSNLSGQKSKVCLDVRKPKKYKLDAEKVEDVTEFMLEQLPIERRLVRQTIVVKCADETKMFRKRYGHDVNVDMDGEESSD